jgi:hypothetical protein
LGQETTETILGHETTGTNFRTENYMIRLWDRKMQIQTLGQETTEINLRTEKYRNNVLETIPIFITVTAYCI